MNWPFLICATLTSSVLVGVFSANFHLAKISVPILEKEIISFIKPRFSGTKEKSVFSPEQIEQKAQSITVKVLSGQTWGSGIIISKQNNIYTVVTNHHVLIFSQDKSYQIQTPDGQVYQGSILETIHFENKDLGLVQFSSDTEYEVTSLSSMSTPTKGERVFAAGFPVEIDNQEEIKGFYFTHGHIAQLSQLDFGGGYQIGYTNNVKKGMSGGPLLNVWGEVVGINGVHKYPLWGNPYAFSDGSIASETKKQEMSQFSWAIPVKTFLQLAPQFSPSDN